MYKQIGVFNTKYSLLIFLLLHKKMKKNTYFIFGDDMNLKFGKQIYNLKKIKFFNNKVLNIFIEIFENTCLKILLFNKNIPIYGQDHIRLGNKLLYKKNFYVIEDGVLSYKNIDNKNKKSLMRNFFEKILGRYPHLGRSENVKKIYLTGLAPVPKEIAHKVEIINLKNLWNNKTLEEQNEILDIFSFDSDIKQKVIGKDIILFTQPLSEDNVVTENEKIAIYSKIIKKYPKERLIIKSHPRELTKYKEIFKNYLVLDNPFPFEILNLLDVRFIKAVTLFSTAALGLGDNIKVDFYGTEVHPKILKKFGSCENIMKRNCYLEEE